MYYTCLHSGYAISWTNGDKLFLIFENVSEGTYINLSILDKLNGILEVWKNFYR